MTGPARTGNGMAKCFDLAGAMRDGIVSIPGNYRGRRATRSATVALDAKDVEESVLCFGGEFGYELLSWIPYLRYVAETTGLRLRTCSRPGTSTLYGFAAEHTEVPFTWRPDGQGSLESAASFDRRFGRAAVYPTGVQGKIPQQFSIAGIQWQHQDIHQRLRATNFSKIELSGPAADFLPADRPVAVVNNKDFDNWAVTDPLLRESFDRQDLIDLRGALQEAGFFVVYHRFDEPVPELRFALADTGLFEGQGCIDMRDIYRGRQSAEIMDLQLRLYRSADLAVCPQGGNSFLPVLAGTRTMVLSKAKARLIEYQDLAGLYDVRVDVFTSTASILDAIRLTGFDRAAEEVREGRR